MSILGTLNGLCTFEDPKLCGYIQSTRDDFDWKRMNGKTMSVNTGPTNDHTYGTSSGTCLRSTLFLLFLVIS